MALIIVTVDEEGTYVALIIVTVDEQGTYVALIIVTVDEEGTYVALIVVTVDEQGTYVALIIVTIDEEIALSSTALTQRKDVLCHPRAHSLIEHVVHTLLFMIEDEWCLNREMKRDNIDIL